MGVKAVVEPLRARRPVLEVRHLDKKELTK